MIIKEASLITSTTTTIVADMRGNQVILPAAPAGTFWEIAQGWTNEWESKDLMFVNLRKDRHNLFTGRKLKKSKLVESTCVGHIDGVERFAENHGDYYVKAEHLLKEMSHPEELGW